MAKAPPSFDFYLNDWHGGTIHLSHVARACYLDLLIYQWQNGSIPNHNEKRRHICRVDDAAEWRDVWDALADKFVALDDECRPLDEDEKPGGFENYGNARMAHDRIKQIRRWKRNKTNGKRGGRPRKTPQKQGSKPRGFSGETQTKPLGKGEGGRGKGISIEEEVQIYPEVLRCDAFVQAWQSWIEYLGSEYKPRGQKSQLTRLSKWGAGRAVAAIEYSIAQGFKGIYEESGRSAANDPRGNEALMKERLT